MRFSVIGQSQTTFFIQLYIEICPFIIVLLPILLSVQLVQCIWFIYKKVSRYYCIVTAFSVSFFKPNQNPQILFLFQFIQLFCPSRAYLRPISNSLYGCSVPYITQHARSLIQFLLLLYNNSCSKLIYSFLYSASCSQIFKVILLLYPSINFLIFKLNTIFTQDYAFSKLIVLKLASYTYLFVFKLSCCPFPLVFIYYGFLGISYYVL